MQTLTLRASFDVLDQVRTFVGEIARRARFSERDIYSVQLAADEAASNVIEHAYGGTTNGQFVLGCEFQSGRLIITVLDHGKSFNPSKVDEPDLKADLADRKVGGLGIYLMRKLMDEVHYESTAAGNLLSLIKRKG